MSTLLSRTHPDCRLTFQPFVADSHAEKERHRLGPPACPSRHLADAQLEVTDSLPRPAGGDMHCSSVRTWHFASVRLPQQHKSCSCKTTGQQHSCRDRFQLCSISTALILPGSSPMSSRMLGNISTSRTCPKTTRQKAVASMFLFWTFSRFPSPPDRMREMRINHSLPQLSGPTGAGCLSIHDSGLPILWLRNC